MTQRLKLTSILLACMMSGMLLTASPDLKSKETRNLPVGQSANRHTSPVGAGISLLITFGLAFGVRRLMDKRIPTDDIT